MAAGEDAFDAPLERSAAAFARLGVRLEEARSRLCHGERLRRAGRRVQARAQLRAALALFERMRCEPWIERTESELRVSGETLRARGPEARRRAHAQELQVATLAAAGVCNKEAAAGCFSPSRRSRPTCTAPIESSASAGERNSRRSSPSAT